MSDAATAVTESGPTDDAVADLPVYSQIVKKRSDSRKHDVIRSGGTPQYLRDSS